MTDRIKGFVVTLSRDLREDDAEPVLSAIRQLKNVLAVEPVIAKGIDEIIAERRVKADISIRLWDALEKK